MGNLIAAYGPTNEEGPKDEDVFEDDIDDLFEDEDEYEEDVD